MSNTTTNTRYISFCGTLVTPTEVKIKQLQESFPYQDDEIPSFREWLKYEPIDSKDSLTVYLAKVYEKGMIGHLVADCPDGGWSEEAFVMLDNEGNPLKSETNLNPNPIPQLL